MEPSAGADTPRCDAAFEHAEHLRRRIRVLAEEVADAEEYLAEVCDRSARLRPHAAPRLHAAAVAARDHAERERRFALSAPVTAGGPDPEPASPPSRTCAPTAAAPSSPRRSAGGPAGCPDG